jgi:hypothetical protein
MSSSTMLVQLRRFRSGVLLGKLNFGPGSENRLSRCFAAIGRYRFRLLADVNACHPRIVSLSNTSSGLADGNAHRA